MRKLLLLFLLVLLSMPAFAQPVQAMSHVSVAVGQKFMPWSANLGISDHVGATVYHFNKGGYEGYLNYKIGNAVVNTKSELRADLLLGGGTEGLIGGLMLGEQHRDFYWNVIAGNIYRVAAGFKPVSRYDWLTVNGHWGKRGYGGSADMLISRRTWRNIAEPKLTVGWGDASRLYIGLKATLGWSM